MTDPCPCESVDHSDFGRVRDDERVLRLVVSPRHLQRQGGLKASVFPLSQFADGISVTRPAHMTLEELKAEGARVAASLANSQKPEPQSPVGVLSAQTADLRASDTLSARDFCVIDDPEPENEAHGLVTVVGDLSEEDCRQLRDILLNRIFSGLLQFEAGHGTPAD